MAESPVVEVRDLVKEFGGFRALGPVSFTMGGGATGLLGPNGAGKTTLLKTLLGLVAPTAGDGRVLGLDITTDRLAVRQRIGYMPERDAYIPNLTGVQYVAFAGELAGLPRAAAMQRAHEVLNYVGLEEERYRLVDTYSTGMRQKAKFAQAIVHDPKLLFLDEPTNGLDPRGRDEMLDLILDVSQRHGIAVVLSSHVLPDVERVCSRVVVLNHGQVLAQGSLEELQRADENVWLVRVKGDPAPLARQLRAHGVRLKAEPSGFLHAVSARPVGAEAILAASVRAGVQVRHLAPKRSTLEELFLGLVEDN